MTTHWEAMFLLAQAADRFHTMARQFRRNGHRMDSQQLLVYLTAAIVAAVLIGGTVAIYKWIARRYANSPTGLLIELCQTHGLPWKQRLLLIKLARSRNLLQPAKLFLEPELYEASSFTPPLQQHKAEIERLRDQIFGKRLDSNHK